MSSDLPPIMKVLINILFMSMVVLPSSSYHVQVDTIKECSCDCPGAFTEGWSVCKKLSRLEDELHYVKGVIEKRNKHVKDLEDLKERMELQEVLFENLLKAVEELKKRNDEIEILPTSEALVMIPDENMLGDSSRDSRMADDRELAKNVTSLLAKVEEVEHLTSKVQEELKSEKRVRRHLEEDLNETRTSIKLLDDRLQNASFPMESRNDIIEEIMISTLENLNKTLFEEHLQKLYYKLDGVAYKNETKELYEHLDEVREFVLDASTIHVSQFADELRSVSDTVANVTEEMTLKETRLNALEAKTSELEDLDGQLSLMMNASELMHGGIDEIWKDVKDLRNYTDNIKKEVREQLIQRDSSSLNVTLEMLEKFENLHSEIITMRTEIDEGKKPISSLRHELAVLATDLALTENRIEGLEYKTDQKLNEIDLKVGNVTDVLSTSLTIITEQISGLTKNTMEELVMGSRCDLPIVNDPHLLMSLDTDSFGQQSLKLGCHPIGRYALDSNQTEISCLNGKWQRAVPSCIKLLDEHEVNSIAEEYKTVNPCVFSFGNIPDPFDCTHYFTCSRGSVRRKQCDPGKHFSLGFKFCEPIDHARCMIDTTRPDKLRDIIPSILINQDTVDKAFSMTGTGSAGELIVYPRAGFTLECLFPETVWGPPSWRFIPIDGMGELPSIGLETNYQNLTNTRLGPNRITASIPVASTQHSGVYMCVTPRNKINFITVIVKDVQCPPIPLNKDGPSNAYYRPHPDGQYRILSTPVEFLCKGALKITALCRADGTWSRPSPTSEECPQEDPSFWGCPPIDTTGRPNLILERDDRDATITFRCAGSTRLIGNAFTRCYEGSWTYTKLPQCARRTL